MPHEGPLQPHGGLLQPDGTQHNRCARCRMEARYSLCYSLKEQRTTGASGAAWVPAAAKWGPAPVCQPAP